MNSLNYNELIYEGYQMKANAETIKLYIKSQMDNLVGALQSNGLNSTRLNDGIVGNLGTLQHFATQIQMQVYAFADFIIKTVPESYIASEESIKGYFDDLKNTGNINLEGSSINYNPFNGS